jgi:hypothetical protein
MHATEEMVPAGRRLAHELAPLIARTEGQGLAALVHLDTAKALTFGGPPKNAGSTLAIDGVLPLLARVLMDRGVGADVDQLAAACGASGGVISASLYLPNHDLVIGRLPGSMEALCLVVRHDKGAMDPMLHVNSVHTRMKWNRENRRSRVSVKQQSDKPHASLWSRLRTAWHGHSQAHQPAVREVARTHDAREDPSRLLHDWCAMDELILAADLFDLRAPSHFASYRRAGCGIGSARSALLTSAVTAIFEGRPAMEALARQVGLKTGSAIGKARIQVGQRDFYLLRVPYYPALHLPFAEREVLMLVKPPRGNPGLDWSTMDRVSLNLLRMRIGEMLSSGMSTQMAPFPANQIEFQAILDRLADLPAEDLVGRLDIGGFAPHPVELGGIEQRCAECIYYLPHRKWCDLPELPVPVEPQWWCRLWKL